MGTPFIFGFVIVLVAGSAYMSVSLIRPIPIWDGTKSDIIFIWIIVNWIFWVISFLIEDFLSAKKIIRELLIIIISFELRVFASFSASFDWNMLVVYGNLCCIIILSLTTANHTPYSDFDASVHIIMLLKNVYWIRI